MSKIYTAIVLKTYFPQKNKIVVLDNTGNKIMAIFTHQMMSVASVINYTATVRNEHAFLSSIEILEMPLIIAHDDIVFLHHVLEICYYFIPLGIPMPEAFNIINFLYSNYKQSWSSYMKKVFLFKLLTIIGIHPDDKKFKTDYFYMLMVTDLTDLLVLETASSYLEEQIGIWLSSCRAVHPLIKKFNTVQFLK